MKKSKLFLILTIVIVLTFIVIVLGMMAFGVIDIKLKNNLTSQKEKKKKDEIQLGKIDDWEYDEKKYANDYSKSINYSNSFAAYDSVSEGLSAPSSSTLGFSTGGAKDINNFRENIKEGYFPLVSDITYEGVYYDYYFDTGKDLREYDEMFYSTATTAVSKDPISEKNEDYVSVGLNSNIKQEDFSRKKLNIVVVLYISGSMSAGIDNYYYDFDEKSDSKTKMKLAEEAVNILIDQLQDEDSFGMVLFDDSAYLAKPLNKVSEVNMSAIKDHILEVKAMGGTNFEAGYKEAQEVFEKYGTVDTNEYENRIIVITDAMPNMGSTNKSELQKLVEKSAKDKIYTTFIGVGLDFNTEVIKTITNVRGANYYSVSSEEEFKTRMGEQFEYMVTPLIFDLNLNLESDSFKIEKIYGTDDIDSENSNEILHINTLFPSASNSSGEVKGGVILLKLNKIKDGENEFDLKVTYETREGKKEEDISKVRFEQTDEYYNNTGIRKAIVLARYVNLIKDWTTCERDKDDRFFITPEIGIIDWYDTNVKDEEYYDDYYYGYYSENERISVNLTVSDEYKEIFKKFKEYMKEQIDILEDESMKEELYVLDKIIDA